MKWLFETGSLSMHPLPGFIFKKISSVEGEEDERRQLEKEPITDEKRSSLAFEIPPVVSLGEPFTNFRRIKLRLIAVPENDANRDRRWSQCIKKNKE